MVVDRNVGGEVGHRQAMIGHERAAAHDIEEHVGEVVSGRDLIAGSLATICRGYELAQLLRRVSDGGARVFGRVEERGQRGFGPDDQRRRGCGGGGG